MHCYEYIADFSESRDNIFVKLGMAWFIYVSKEEKVITAKRITDHLEKMTEWSNFVRYDTSEKEQEAIEVGIAHLVLHTGEHNA